MMGFLSSKGKSNEKSSDSVQSNPKSMMTGTLATNYNSKGLNDVAVVESHKCDESFYHCDDDSASHDQRSYEGEDDPGQIIDFMNDDVKDMTYGRRIALRLMKYKWYYPGTRDPNEKEGDSTDEEEEDSAPLDDFDEHTTPQKPCLKRGWEFFEHQALFRYLVDKNDPSSNSLCPNSSRKYNRADPGEDLVPTRLYPWFSLPHKQLGDFGLGIGLYFSTLRALIFLCLTCGLISMYNIIYFAGEKYDHEGFNNVPADTSFSNFFMAGSAVCHAVEWVPCPNCTCIALPVDEWGALGSNRCAAASSSSGANMTFVMKNNCDGTPWQLATTNFVTVVFTVFAFMLMGRYMKNEEVMFDEDEQTAQDYSVLISNPPSDAKDPEEWRRFFHDNLDGAKVTVCTCAVRNDLLIQSLVERRERIRSIQSINPEISLDALDLARTSAEIERGRGIFGRFLSKLAPGIPEHFSRLVALKARVEGLAQLEYPVTNVFVTFETEEDQRYVLENLSVGSSAWGTVGKGGNASALKSPKHLFRNDRVLSVTEPEEPNTIRWEDLNVGHLKQLKLLTVTTLITLGAVFVVAIAIYLTNQVNVLWCAYSITFFGMIFPMFAKLMTNNIEVHRSESSKQASLYFKIALFRWVTTAIVIFLVTPFADTIRDGSEGIIAQVFALFISDMTLTNAVAVLDPAGHLQRHLLAPRAKTQDAMDILFQGTPYELAERYTDMTKILLLCLFYCSIFPSSFFLCAISLTLKYYCDRFNLMNTWKRAPHIGPEISKISRIYFFGFAICMMAIWCSYYWAGFPFDNLCPNDKPVNASYVGNFTLKAHLNYTNKFVEENITIFEDATEYRYCNMDFLDTAPYFSFPFVPSMGNPHIQPREYMTRDQIVSTTYCGWSAFAVLVAIFMKHCVRWYRKYKQLTGSSYKAVGETQGINFSDVPSRSAYIPQVISPVFAYPLIACKVDGIDEELFEFRDPDRTFRYYDLSMDAKRLLKSLDIDDPPGFSVVKWWEP